MMLKTPFPIPERAKSDFAQRSRIIGVYSSHICAGLLTSPYTERSTYDVVYTKNNMRYSPIDSLRSRPRSKQGYPFSKSE